MLIVQFLSLRRRRSEQGTSCKNQIFTFIVCIPVHKEILLFRSDARGDLGRFGISEGMVMAAGPGGKDIFLLSPDAGAKPGHQVK